MVVKSNANSPPDQTSTGTDNKPYVQGKFFFRGASKFFLSGVTYGPFGSEGKAEYNLDDVERDFARIKAAGMNSVRLYTVPPRWLRFHAAPAAAIPAR